MLTPAGAAQNLHSYLEASGTSTLLQALQFKQVLEFPTFMLALPHEKASFSVRIPNTACRSLLFLTHRTRSFSLIRKKHTRFFPQRHSQPPEAAVADADGDVDVVAAAVVAAIAAEAAAVAGFVVVG